MTVDFDDFDEVFFGNIIETAAADTGVGKGIEADVRNRAQAMGRNVAEILSQGPLGQVVCLDFVVVYQGLEGGNGIPVA